MPDPDDLVIVESSFAGIQRVATTPKPPDFFRDRQGYAAAFLGDRHVVDLPVLTDAIPPEDIAHLADGSTELKYEHFSTVHCKSRKSPLYSACNIDGAQSKRVPRHDTWNYDGRIPKAYQMLRDPYGPQAERKFSRGHMTRRQDPNWGPLAVAQRANIDTFFATNACPQWQPFNEGLWGDLEDHLLAHAQGDAKRVSVITGPFLKDTDPERFGAKIPRDFWKVVAFVSEATGGLTSISYVMGQGRYLDTGTAKDLEDFALSQRPLAYVEQHTGLRFESLAGCDVLDGAALESVQPIRRPSDTKLPLG